MTTRAFLLTAWTWNPLVLVSCVLALALYLKRWKAHSLPRALSRGERVSIPARLRLCLFLAALGVLLLALCSPLNALALGCLFSAHMTQHILLLMVVPVLLVPSLSPSLRAPAFLRRPSGTVLAWACGVGAMWFWHVPALCDAASSRGAIHGLQSASLLAAGALFWWPIFAPGPSDRLAPWTGVGYLFAACLACTALGILITLTPLEICPLFQRPTDPYGMLPAIRDSWGISAARDRALGGLLMWVPVCAMYVGAIALEMARWYGPARPAAQEARP